MSESKWKLSLDIKDFVKDGKDAKEVILGIGDAKNLEGLISALSKTTAVLGVVGIAALALKTTVEAVFDAEKIRAVNAQFEITAKNAGLAGDALREGVVDSAKGLAVTTDVINASTKAIVQLGDKAAKLPEIMDLARKTAKAFGGDMLENFEAISQAVASGNLRSLRNLGIIIDQDVALKKYAKTLHVSVEELSDAGKKQAFLNEVLEKGNASLDGVDSVSKKATGSWKRIKVAVSEISEAITLLIDKLFGGQIAKGFELMANSAVDMKNRLVAAIGDGREKSEAELKNLEKDIKNLQYVLDQEHKFHLNPGDLPNMEKRMERLVARKKEVEAELSKGKSEGVAGEGGEGGRSDIDREAQAKAQSKFDKELLQLRKMRHEEEIKAAQFGADMEAEVQRDKEFRIDQINQESKIRREAINQEYANKDIERLRLLEQESALTAARMLQVDEETKRRRLELLKEQTDHAQTAASGIADAFHEGAEKNRQDLTNWGNTGRLVFGAFSKNAKSALLEFGAGTKDAGEAMRGFLFGAIADTAEAKGMELLLSSIWPPNPVGAAAGAGLVALAGALRSQAGGAGKGGGVGGGGAGGGGASAGAGSPGVEGNRPTTNEPETKKAVSITVQGPWFDTDQSQRWLTDQIRSASDNTDFSFRRIGQT